MIGHLTPDTRRKRGIMYTLETLTVDRARARLADAACREVFDYWDRLRGDRIAPDRRELEPFDIAGALGDIIMLDTDGGAATFRMAGSRLTAALGRELRGEVFTTLWAENDQTRLLELLQYAQECPAGLVINFDIHTPTGREQQFEAVLLPLQLDGPLIRRLVGVATPVQRPFWLGCERASILSLRSATLFPTIPGAALAKKPIRSHPVFNRTVPRRRLRHLALYDGDLA